MRLSIDRFGVILDDEEKHIDFEDIDESKFEEIMDLYNSEISLLEDDRNFIKKKWEQLKKEMKIWNIHAYVIFVLKQETKRFRDIKIG